MKVVFGGIAAGMVGIAAYFTFAGSSSEEDVIALLAAEFDGEATATLEGCDLRISTVADTGTGFVEVDLRADLRLYDFQTVKVVPTGELFTYVASRTTATNAMVDQARAVFGAAGDEIADMLPDDDDVRAALNTPEGNLSMRLTALSETDSEGNAQLMPHEDGPRVHAYIEAVKQLPGPVSYMAAASYVGADISATGLRTGEVIAVPQLTLRFGSREAVQVFGQAIYNHTAVECS